MFALAAGAGAGAEGFFAAGAGAAGFLGAAGIINILLLLIISP